MRNIAPTFLLSALLASTAVGVAAQEPLLPGEGVLNFAFDACGQQSLSNWAPARRGDYLESLVDYHYASWDAQGVGGGLAAYELLDEDGNLIDFTLPSGKRFEALLIKTAVYGNGVKVSGCSIYLSPHDALSTDEMRQWSTQEPSEMLVGIAANESSWQLRPPEDSGWDYTIVSAFDFAVPQSPYATPHPFRGLIVRFTKTEF